MEILFWSLIGLLTILLALLFLKIRMLHKAAEEIKDAFADRLQTDTNTLIGLSSRDKPMQELAASINVQLRELRRERRRFQQGDSDLKQAITNLSHDIRTPLTAICGYLELLEQEELPPHARSYVAVIQNRTALLAQMTEELFQYSVVRGAESPLQIRAVSLHPILEESIAAFYASFQAHHITPEIEMPDHAVYAMTDPAALSRVFANLFCNVLKYSSGDLRICLSKDGEIRFTNYAPKLNEVQVGKLFDRFYTVEAAQNATGLGLSITRTLLHQMGGSIQASYENQHLIISIRLPNAKDSP